MNFPAKIAVDYLKLLGLSRGEPQALSLFELSSNSPSSLKGFWPIRRHEGATMNKILVMIAWAGVFFAACAKKEKTFSQDYIPAKISADAVPAISRQPTNPDGGKVPGKVSDLDPEESAKRKAKHEILPIEFGVGVAGITMQTTQDEARDILSPARGEFQGFEIYDEHIRVQWNRANPPKPEAIVIDDGYPGELTLPEPYGKLRVGQSLKSVISSEDDLVNFMRVAGASFEKMGDKPYLCDQVLTCRLGGSAAAIQLEFVRGGMIVSRDAELTLQVLYFTPPQKFFPRILDPIVYGTSIGGVSYATSRADFESKFGPPEQFEDGIYYYDQSSLGIAWGPDNKAIYMGALGTFQGTMDLGPVLGKRRIGDSFTSYAAATDDGTLLMLALDRQLEGRAADYNCATQTVPECSLKKVGDFLVVILAKGTFVFTADSTRRLLLFEMMKAP